MARTKRVTLRQVADHAKGSPMNGKIVLQRWVTGTNTHAYSPEVHFLNTPITVQIENGHVVNLEGDAADVAAFRAHGRMWPTSSAWTKH